MTQRTAILAALATGAALAAGPVRADAPPPDGGAVVEPGPNLNVTRQGFTCTRLADGRLVVFGGQTENWVVLSTAEVLETDSLSGASSWRVLQMRQTHGQGMGARLADGRFLLAGGTGDGGEWPGHTGAEVYDPRDDSFTETGAMTYGRAASGVATLAGGRVLVVGTWWGDGAGSTYGDVWNPANGIFSVTKAMNHPRASCLALPCDDGTAVVFGGYTPSISATVDPVESFDPATESFTVIADTILPGEPGWTAWTQAGNYQRPFEDHNRLADGRTMLLLYLPGTPYRYRLAAFDPATKTFAAVGTATTLHDSDAGWYLTPVVDAAGTHAVLPCMHPDTWGSPHQVQVETVDVATAAVVRPTTWFDVGPVPRFEAGGILRDAAGRLVLVGGRAQANPGNYAANDRTLFVTVPGDAPEPPVAPADLTAAAESGASVRLDWTDASGDEDGFRVERALPEGEFATVHETGPDAATWTDTGLGGATQYLYRVCAFNDAGDSDFTDVAAAVTHGGKAGVPKRLSFGRVRTGRSKTLRLTIRNLHRREPLWILPDVSGPGFLTVDAPYTLTLAPRKSYRLKVRFTPEAKGASAGSLDLTTSEAASGTAVTVRTIRLTGSGR